MKNQNIGDYEILFQWAHLDWDFEDESSRKFFRDNEFFKGAMPAALKTDSAGNYYMSVPRWSAGIPATLNRVVMKNGKAVLRPFPDAKTNEEGSMDAMQSILGFEIDENDILWALDQGHVMDKPSLDGSQKIFKWDLKKNNFIGSIKIPDDIASYKASFLNDICVDNENGFAYIADSGIYTDPLEGGLIILNTKTNELRRVLHQHESTQDVDGFGFEIDGTKVWKDTPMRTGADGIALSHDRKTLYWCPLTSRNLYSIRTELLRDFKTTDEEIGKAVKDLGSKGTNTDGLTADNKGRIWYTMLEGMGMGYYDPAANSMNNFVSDKRMIWVDTPHIDNSGHILFSSNQLHFLNKRELDYTKPDNLIIWKAYIGEGVKSYLFK
jgi:sugar lactone lactonase YvrE